MKKPRKAAPSADARTIAAPILNKGYSEAGASHTRKALVGMKPNSGSPAEDINENLLTLRQRSRMLYMGAPLATSAIRTNRTNVVGNGLQLKSTIDYVTLGMTQEQAEEWQRHTENEFKLWASNKRKAGLTDIAPTECSCSRMIELYKRLGRWQEADSYAPKIGDVIMYDWQDKGVGDNTGAPDHVGIVVAVNGTSLTILEGNKSEALAYRALNVNGRYIRGYCLPDYASKATATEVSASTFKIASAKSFNRVYAKTYTVTASALNMRIGAGTDRPVIKTLRQGTRVICYGYYTQNGATVWLYVKDQDGTLGYCSKKYLK